MKKLRPYADFLYEVGILNHTPRSGFRHLGSHRQSVAEHTHRMLFIVLVLIELEKKKVDKEKVLMMVMVHDFGEARALDLDWISQKYNTSDEVQAVKESTQELPFGKDFVKLLEEYKERKSTESVLVKEVDHLELLLTLREIEENGNKQAKIWIKDCLKRLKTNSGKELAKEILKTSPVDWWRGEGKEIYWITGGRGKK